MGVTKNLGHSGVPPLGLEAWLTPRNMPLPMCHYIDFGRST